MRAIAAGADNASDLGWRMSMSKQAAAKIVEALLAQDLTRARSARDSGTEPDPWRTYD